MHNIKKAYISILTVSTVGMGIYSIIMHNEYQQLKTNMSVVSEQHEIELELQKSEYMDAIIEVKQDLLETQFYLDMSINHIERINVEMEDAE